MTALRILAFSDLHGDRDAADRIVEASVEADVVVGAGDFGTCGEGERAALRVLERLGCPLVLVSGNHDRRAVLEEWCAEARSGRHLLHGTAITIGGVTFVGLGDEVPRIGSAPWNGSMEEDEAAELLARAPGCDVLVTHTPPLGHADRQADGSHEGSSAILAAIRRDEPRLCLCGHIHHSWGSRDAIGRTVVHNLGPQPHWHAIDAGA